MWCPCSGLGCLAIRFHAPLPPLGEGASCSNLPAWSPYLSQLFSPAPHLLPLLSQDWGGGRPEPPPSSPGSVSWGHSRLQLSSAGTKQLHPGLASGEAMHAPHRSHAHLLALPGGFEGSARLSGVKPPPWGLQKVPCLWPAIRGSLLPRLCPGKGKDVGLSGLPFMKSIPTPSSPHP